MKIYTVCLKKPDIDEPEFFSDVTEAGAFAQLAAYCRKFLKENGGYVAYDEMGDQSVVDAYLKECDGDAFAWFGSSSIPLENLPKLYVIMDGGLVQEIASTDPDQQTCQIAVLDYDTDGAQEDGLVKVMHKDGDEVEASMSSYELTPVDFQVVEMDDQDDDEAGDSPSAA